MITLPGTDHDQMLHEATNDYPNVEFAGRTVLDLGAHIGGFTTRAVQSGAEFVVAVEPWLPSFDLLVQNCSYLNVVLMKKAIGNDFSVDLSIGNPWDTGGVSSKKNRKTQGRTERVLAVRLDELLAEYKPAILKMDIEGAEYDVLPTDLTGVEQFCGEFHTTQRGNRSAELLNWLEQDFEVTITSRSMKRVCFYARRKT